MCGFYQTLTKYKGVWKKTHMFVKNQTGVSFSKQVVLLFVFALVFEFLIFDITRPKPAYGRQGLDWIVGPGYSFVVFSTKKTKETNQKP